MLRSFYKEIVADESVEYIVNNFFSSISIQMIPGVNGSMKLQYRYSKYSTYKDGPLGTFIIETEDVIDAPVYSLKIFAIDVAGIVAIIQA